jgi:Rha family phage regulatory protein
MRTTSMAVADLFGKSHKHVLLAIRNLPTPASFKENHFSPVEFIDGRGRTQPGCELTRDGFTILAMGFHGPKALEWKLKYLEAFNAMETKLIELAKNAKAPKAPPIDWAAARLQGKQARKDFTDTVKKFVDYATAQGSQSASKYYMNLTKMEYQALDLLDLQKTAIGNFRDTLDGIDVGFLHVAEIVAARALEAGMADGIHYKEVFQLAKQKVQAYAATVSMPVVRKYKLLQKA